MNLTISECFVLFLNNFAIHFDILFLSSKTIKGMQFQHPLLIFRSAQHFPFLICVRPHFESPLGGFAYIYNKRTTKLSFYLCYFYIGVMQFCQQSLCNFTKYSASTTTSGFLPFFFITTIGS